MEGQTLLVLQGCLPLLINYSTKDKKAEQDESKMNSHKG